MTKEMTQFPGFKMLLFPHCCQILILLSLQVSTGMIRWQLHKELIGMQHRGGGNQPFLRREEEWVGTPKCISCWRKKKLLHQWLIFRMHPTHPSPPRCPLGLANIPHHLVPNATSTMCNHNLTEDAARKKKAGVIFSFFFSFFNLSFVSSEITYKW